MAFPYLTSLLRGARNDVLESDVDDEEDFGNESDIELERDVNDGGDGQDEALAPDQGDSDTESESEIDGNGGAGNEFPWSSTLREIDVELFTDRSGPNMSVLNLTYDSSPTEFFKLYFDDELFTLAEEQTNLYATQCGAPTTFKRVKREEISHYLYINMMFGIIKLPSFRLYWSSDPLLRVPAVADVMSRNRYMDISRYFHLADRTTYIPRNELGHDPLHKIRPVINSVLTACQTYYQPGECLSVDEAMIPFKGRLYFKQYLKGKPHPWGVKVWCCCDSKNGYLSDFSFYTGKNERPSAYGLGYDVVTTLVSRFLYQRRHVYFDNFFSSVRLVKDLLDKDTYSCGTIRSNRKHWPNDLKLKGKVREGECRMRQVGNIVACFWKDKRPVCMISSNASPGMGSADRRTKDGLVDKDIPVPVLKYNDNMAGVDLSDQLRTYYPVGRKSYKWWRSCFWFLVEVALLNGYIVYKSMPRPDNTKPLSHFQFHVEVARSLMQGASPRRAVPETGPHAAAFNATHTDHRRVRLPGRKKGCFMCRKKDVRTPSGKRPETVFGCARCNTHLCDELCFNTYHEIFIKK